MNSRITGKDRKFIADLLNRLGTIDYIQPGDFPSIDLYMDQVTTFMDNHLVHCKRKEEVYKGPPSFHGMDILLQESSFHR